MSITRLVAGCVFAAAVAAAAPASAATKDFISTGDGNSGVEAIHGSSSWEGWYGATLYLIGSDVTIDVTYHGAEAGFDNKFSWGLIPSQLFNTGGGTDNITSAPNGDFLPAQFTGLNSQVLPFSFQTQNGDVVNGLNPLPESLGGSGVNFFVSFETSGAGSGQTAWLWLDDIGGADNDDNHDDMVIRLQITNGSITTGEPGTEPVPLPGAALLLLSGIGGFGLLRMKAKRAAKKGAAAA